MNPAGAGPSYVVDTSVVIKWLVERDEPHRTQALRLRAGYIEGQCMLRAPELMLFELANVLITGRKLRPSLVRDLLESIRALDIYLEPFRWSTLATAVEIASVCAATVYDSYFLALAHECDATLVTADEVFIQKAKRYAGIVYLGQLQLPN